MVCNDFVKFGNLFSYCMQLCIFVEHGILNDLKKSLHYLNKLQLAREHNLAAYIKAKPKLCDFLFK